MPPIFYGVKTQPDWPMFRSLKYALLLALGLAAPMPFALSHQVDDFRQDFSGKVADTVGISRTFGDTLWLSVVRKEYRSLGHRLLTDGRSLNGQAGTASMAASRSIGHFDIAYVSWTSTHSSWSGSAPAGDIHARKAYITDDSAGFEIDSRFLAENEFPPPNASNRAPSHFVYEMSGARYAAYWSNLDNGRLRRTSDIAASGGSPSGWGSDVGGVTPVTSQAYGVLTASLVPGSDARQTVVAYLSSLTGGSSTLDIRWEDLTNNTSASVSFNRGGGATAPEEVSAACDSLGNTVLLWREGSMLYFTAYSPSRTLLQGPIAIGNIAYNDGSSTLHFYRSFHVIALRKNDFQIVYARGAQIYSRHLTVAGSGATVSSTEIPVSKSGSTSLFPSAASNGSSIAFAWFQRVTADNHKLKATVFALNNGLPDTSTRIDIDVASDSVGFTEVAPGWTPYHFFQTASVAMDSSGNLAVGYEDGYHAKAALVKFAAIYAATGTFVSKPLGASNPIVGTNYDPNIDSVEYRPMQATAVGQVAVTLAFSRDSAFSSPADSFRTVTAPVRTSGGVFKYRARLQTQDTARLFTSRLLSLTVPYNVKPRVPVVDSVRYAHGSWRPYNPADTNSLIRRRDTVEMSLSAIDLDDADSMDFAVRLGNRLLASARSGKKNGAGRHTVTFRFAAPDTLLPQATLTLQAIDAENWSSNPGSASIKLADVLPVTVVTAFRRRGLDSSGKFYPALGVSDTLAMKNGDTLWVHAGDSLRLRATVSDVNDDTVTLGLKKVGGSSIPARIATGAVASFVIPPPTTAGATDAWLLQTGDPDTTLDFRLYLKVNYPPVLDSLWLASYQLRDGSRKSGGGNLRVFSGTPGLLVPAQVPALLRAAARDLDVAGQKPAYRLQLLRRGANCALNDRSCVSVIGQADAESLSVTVQGRDDQLSLRATDARGAFTEAWIHLDYALADTSSAQQYHAQAVLLDTAMDFVMFSGTLEKTVNIVVRSLGSTPLQLTSAITSRNQASHLELTLNWKDSASANQSKGFPKGTNQDPLTSSSPVSVPVGQDLTVKFRFFTSALKGDTIFTDTLILRTNDLAAPVLRIPFRLIHRELPRLNRLGTLDLDSGDAANARAGNLPLTGGLRLTFSEPVLVPAAGFLTVYSLLDSLANPKGYKPIPGSLIKRKAKPGGLGKKAGDEVFMTWARAKMGALADSLADTVIFIPAYAKPSDSLKAQPRPGSFLHYDILRVRVRNTPTDPMGNPLDLRHERAKRAAGTLDTLFTLRTDTSVLRVIRSQPAMGDTAVDPDASLRLVFNRPLAVRPPPAWTGLPAVDLQNLTGGENASFRITSLHTQGRELNFAALQLVADDTVLIIKMREKAGAYDTVTLTLSGSISDTDGNTLDGDGDGFPAYLYRAEPGVDDYSLTFATGRAGFYVFPNPFRFDNERHRQKGAVTFKNLNSLAGWKAEKTLSIRIHDMTGDLVWSDAQSSSTANRRGRVMVDWDLRNTQGTRVATGVYLYSITDEADRLLMKGKVAVIR